MSAAGVRVLVVDDEPAIRRYLRAALSAHGYSVVEATSGPEALDVVAAEHPEVVLLDLGLPEMDGVEVTRRLREWTQIPIIVVSVRGAEADKVAALDAGADDYLTKPFGSGELLARLRAALRRASQPASVSVFNYRELSVDLNRRRVEVGGQEVLLTPKEYELLRVLVSQAGKVVTHRQLLNAVWGAGYEQELHMLHVNISNLRRKIEPEPARPRFVITEPAVGYRLRAE